VYRGRGRADAIDDEEPEILDVPTRSWKEVAGRTSGRDGYVFGDVSRGVIARFGGSGGKTDDAVAEKEGDEQHTQVQKLVRDAVRLYRARGYNGSINMGQTVAYFNESVSVKVDGPGAGEALPWEKDGEGECSSDELAAAVTEEAIALALSEDSHKERAAAAAAASSTDAMCKQGQANLVFATLLARLERRAQSWRALNGEQGLDANLTQSAQIGFAIPIVKLGWGVSVSLTVSASTLLRWSDYEASRVAAQ